MHVSWSMNINGHIVHLIWSGYHCIKMLHVSTSQSLFGRFAVLCAIGPPKTSLSDVKTSENGDNSRQLEWLLELKSLSSTWSATLAERFLSLRPCSVKSMTWKQRIAVRWHVSIFRDMRSQCHDLQNEGFINLIWLISDMLFPRRSKQVSIRGTVQQAGTSPAFTWKGRGSEPETEIVAKHSQRAKLELWNFHELSTKVQIDIDW